MIMLRIAIDVEKQTLGWTWNWYNISGGYLDKNILFNKLFMCIIMFKKVIGII